MSNNFPPPKFNIEERASLMRTGFFIFNITCLLYSCSLYLFIWVARELEIVSWKLDWQKTSLIVWVFMFLRFWDRVFRRTKSN